MRKPNKEVRCSASVVPYLGVEHPKTLDEHRKLRDAGTHLLVRDRDTLSAFFWPYFEEVTMVSS